MSWVNLLDMIYPVGSIYCSTSPASPAGIVGGSWSEIENAVLRSSNEDSGYTGSDSHVISASEAPTHTHPFRWGWNSGNPSSGSDDWLIVLQNSYDGGGSGTITDPTNGIGYNVGGGKQCRLFNALSTVISGIELLNITSFQGGDLVWLG